MKRTIAVTPICLMMIGCATLPDTTYKYFPAQALTKVTATQVFDCDDDNNLVVYYSPAPVFETKFSSNREKQFSMDIKKLRGAFADTDVKVTWYSDGRLKSVNADTTGQGELIVKAAAGLVAAVGGAEESGATVSCEGVKALEKGEPVILNYYMNVPSSANGALKEMSIAAASQAAMDSLATELGDNFPRIEVTAAKGKVFQPLVVTEAEPKSTAVTLQLNIQGEQVITINAASQTVGKATVVVPLDEYYDVKILKPKAFGKQVFSVVLNESGGLEQQGYGRLNGAAAALGATTAAYGVVSPTDKAVAEAAKNEADIIAQTTRLAACRRDPATCK